jgi:3-methyladenine DNA glycosylase AlkD
VQAQTQMAKSKLIYPKLSPRDYVMLVRKKFSEAGDPIRAEGQMRYMRNKYAYYGLKAPEWVAILKEVFAEYGMYDGKDLRTFARLCFNDEYHEIFYAGLQMIEKQIKTQRKDFIDFLEKAIMTGAWWDTVDWISKLVGIHFKRYPELQHEYARKWISSENIWLQRVAIIHQLLYKDKTDQKLLFEMILKRKNSPEFFVQKGAGWALRQYSKTNPKAVREFISKNPELSPLTRREGMKWLKKG